MGLLQGQPDALDSPTPLPEFSSVADHDAWLDRFLAQDGLKADTVEQRAAVRLRLAGIPFDLILAAIEREQPGRHAAAEVALYGGWIEANPTSLLLGVAWFNMGVTLARTGDAANAVTAYRNVIALRPDLHAASINLGLLLEADGRTDDALTAWRSGIQPDDVRVALGIQEGRLLEKLGRFGEAERALHRVLLIDPGQHDVIHHWVHIRQKSCLWPAIPDAVPSLPPKALLRHSGPLGVLALSDDIHLQSEAAASWVARKTEPAPRRLAPAQPYGHERIRIGYMSSDFCSHAMSYLITELFERHDRSRFEVFGYCASKDDGSQLRQRVVTAFDHHRVIRLMSDADAALMIRGDEIDVLVDLNGLTEGSRLAVLRWKPAPIQASYLGFIGPLPLPELDYLFCDTMVVPPEHESAYLPQPLPIARLYQVNDSKRTIGRRLSRAELGLPEDRFVFCCFSRHYKITEAVFGAWMSILREAEGAVLWLAADNPYSEANLKASAARAGIDADRLIISERADPDLYLSRLAVADLFLDTFPYNAGTVASDAIRMELPILTLCGAAFASRMAASLLRMVGATAGITTSLPRYVETAVRLATDPAAHASYKALFTTAAWQSTIGDIAGFTAAYEATILRVVAAAHSSDAPRPVVEHPPHAPALAKERAWVLPFGEAVQHHQAGRLEEAETLYRVAVGATGAPASVHFNLGLVCMARERPAEAAEAFRDALTQQPDMAEAIINLGTAMMAMGRLEEAEAAYRQALAMRPDSAMAHGNLGKVLQDLGRLDEAFVAYHTARELEPGNADVLINLGAALLERRELNEAVAVTRSAIALRPHSAIAHANLAVALVGLGEHEAALLAGHEAMARAPRGAAIAATLGGVMLEVGEAAEAASLCRQAIALDPYLPNAQFNLSHACKALNELAAAQEAAEAAIALSPLSPVYHFHLAHILLLRGDMARGWEEYEWRWDLPDFSEGTVVRRAFLQPQWAGEEIRDKTILVYTEQGLGDIIQFARYLPLLTRRARRVIVAANPLTRQLLGRIADITLIGADEIAAQSFDFHCPLLSLPRAFGTRLESIPAAVPYLSAEPMVAAGWANRIGGDGLRVGIVWAGNPATKRDRFRSPRLRSVAPLFDIPGITFVALQMGPGRTDAASTPLPPHVIDLGDEINDLADTAAIMATLDLMISSCTAPLHLAGALGLRSWAMIPYAPHFPWLLERRDTPWYPSMRLYRQCAPGLDWSSVVDGMAEDLVDLRDRHPRSRCTGVVGAGAAAGQSAAAALSVSAG